MWHEDYLKRHALISQIGIGAIFGITFTVAMCEHKLEAEHRFYRDDLPAHVYPYDTSLNASYCMASGSTIGTSNFEQLRINSQ